MQKLTDILLMRNVRRCEHIFMFVLVLRAIKFGINKESHKKVTSMYFEGNV